MTQIIDGKGIALEIRGEIAKEVEQLKQDRGFVPGLGVVLVGDNPASQVYVRMKEKACEQAGIYSEEHRLSAETTQEDLTKLVNELNSNPKIHGILVQLPLPDHLDENAILEAVDPKKDVDGFHPVNVGKLVTNQADLVACTPLGVIKLLEKIGCEIKGKNAVIVGRSNIVGKPTAMLLMHRHATITVCHSRTQNLPDVVRQADIVIAAIGRAKFIKGDWIKPGAVVIDVGINRQEDKKLVGDVDFEEAKEVAGWITPVPGGVGPMTIAMLLYNTLLAAKNS
jgi:methylenetetrahydrofolate dehydrogenase (NADP+)/methenyltetrahydrofolate cyclohydrolase